MQFTKLQQGAIVTKASIIDNSLIINHDGTLFINSWLGGLVPIGQLMHLIEVHCQGNPIATARILELAK